MMSGSYDDRANGRREGFVKGRFSHGANPLRVEASPAHDLRSAERTRGNHPGMLVVHVQVQVKPAFIEAFKHATLENAAASVHEPGIVRFDVIQSLDDPTRFVLVEIYRDEQAPARHKETAHYSAWRDRVADFMAVPRTSTKYSAVFPEPPGWELPAVAS